MTKKEIIKFLQKEVGFIDVMEDKNELDEFYITEAKFKELSEIIDVLKRRTTNMKSREIILIEKIKKSEGSYIDISDNFLNDKVINAKGDVLFLNPKNLILKNCNFLNKGFYMI